jgi:hypothetical protein
MNDILTAIAAHPWAFAFLWIAVLTVVSVLPRR